MPDIPAGELIACHQCDHLHRHVSIPVGGRANCDHCGSLLYRHVPDSLNRSLALYFAALILLLIANCFPFLSLTLGGRVVDNILLSAGWAMYEMGMAELGLLIFFTSIGFPLITILGMLYLLISVRLGHVPPAMGPVYRLAEVVTPWSLVSVFMLGVLIAIVKLQDIANVIIGPSFFALSALLVVYAAARANLTQGLSGHSRHTQIRRNLNWIGPGAILIATLAVYSAKSCPMRKVAHAAPRLFITENKTA